MRREPDGRVGQDRTCGKRDYDEAAGKKRWSHD
jgi:hypothetical protein